ncbi:MAG TPA: hypothetical protein PK177_19580, partial [Burkholderiaceae bacterium]|nr:hypothetical protein [Burkholderiaceae bacterium]
MSAGSNARSDDKLRADADLHSGDVLARGLSAMLWFRADPTRDDEVLVALRQVAGSIASLASSRIGHRPEEDRPYRTWMIDAGPVDASRLDSLMWRLQKAFNAAGLPALSRGEQQFERCVGIDDAEPG